MTDEEIKNLARQIYRGEVFTSYNKGVDESNLPMIFMPLALLDEKSRQKLIDGGADMLYAPMSGKVPMSIDGMPVFMEFKWCNKEDTAKVLEKLFAIEKVVEEVTE